MTKYIVAIVLFGLVLLANIQSSMQRTGWGTGACRGGCPWDKKCVCTPWRCHCVPKWVCYTWGDCKVNEKCVNGECKDRFSASYGTGGK